MNFPILKLSSKKGDYRSELENENVDGYLIVQMGVRGRREKERMGQGESVILKTSTTSNNRRLKEVVTEAT
ncbi:hypothetical protein NECAME_15784 [Necator americanus]|uniref:Uncharacterized protein n=1 Tax=Necator americanus TaxID=51031 RepID=W2SID3_NECAM|nr:hypothetical protein NECAME_15784 [Necator americanus]ETN68517.1 hypothetical protein NECAME_15784 [Necator americanus]